jgi:hypothetical protein
MGDVGFDTEMGDLEEQEDLVVTRIAPPLKMDPPAPLADPIVRSEPPTRIGPWVGIFLVFMACVLFIVCLSEHTEHWIDVYRGQDRLASYGWMDVTTVVPLEPPQWRYFLGFALAFSLLYCLVGFFAVLRKCCCSSSPNERFWYLYRQFTIVVTIIDLLAQTFYVLSVTIYVTCQGYAWALQNVYFEFLCASMVVFLSALFY